MSWLAFETLTLQPDFSEDPTYGLEGGRSEVPGLGQDWVAWQGHTNALMRFRYRTVTENEFKDLREFLDRQRGRWGAFYVPSWRKDFELHTNVTGGAGNTLTVTGGWHTANVTEAKPDTVGRRIFIVSQAGVYADYWVESFVDDGGGNDILTLDRTLANNLTAGITAIGLVYFVRLSTDDVGTTIRAINLSEIDLTFRAIKHTSQTEDDLELS